VSDYKPVTLFLVLLIISSGCITMTKNAYRDNFAPTPIPTTMAPIQTPIGTPILTPIITPIPAPTLDPHIAFKMRGGYNMSEWFSFSRKTYRDMIDVKVTVYRYQIRDHYSVPSRDQDNNTYRWSGAGNNFLFIWARIISNSSTPLGGYDYKDFKINYKGRVIEPTLELGSIKELSGYYDLPHKYNTGPYGYYWGVDYDSNKLSNLHKYMEYEEFLPGESNAWDGYILYLIPKSATIDDLIVTAKFESMFKVGWQFVNGDKFSLETPPLPISYTRKV